MTLIDHFETWDDEGLESALLTYWQGDTGATLTRGELRAHAYAIAAQLSRLAGPGDRALLVFPPGYEYLCAFYGALCAGVTAVPVYPPTSRAASLNQFLALVQDSEPKVLLTTAEFGDQFDRSGLTQLSRLPRIATNSVADSDSTLYGRPEIDPETIAYLQYTSGSTGTPRGVVHSHGNVEEHLRFVRRTFEIGPDTRYALWLPLYHDMGLISSIAVIRYGRHLSIMSPLSFIRRPMDWLHMISRERAGISGAPNFAFDLCARQAREADLESLDLSRWTLAYCGSEPVRAQTLERFCQVFAPCGFQRSALAPCYGLAEATLLVSVGGKREEPVVRSVVQSALAQGRAVRAGSPTDATDLVACGQVHPEAEVAIVEPETRRRSASGEIGEIWVRGAGIGRGYWRRAEESELVFGARIEPEGEGPFLRTGDLGFLDGDQLFVTGRIKDLIVIHGRNYYPPDIEAVVGEAHEAVRQDRCAAVALAGSATEELAVFFELEREAPRDLALGGVITAVREAVSESCELSPTVIGVVNSGALPRTPSGKVRRSSCRDAFLAHELALLAVDGEVPASAPPSAPQSEGAPDEGPSPDVEAVRTRLIEEIERITGRSVDGDAVITRLGLTSVNAIDIMFEIETEFGLPIDAEHLNDAISIAELAERIVAGTPPTAPAVLVTGAAAPSPAHPARADRRPLDVSLMYFSTDTLQASARFELLLESARFADEHDFSALWIPERHFHAFGGAYPNPSVAAAALAVITSKIRLRAGSVVLPLHNPLRVAEEWAFVDNLSRGRVDLSFATGWNPNDFALAPASYDDRRAMTLASIKQVHRLWAGEPTVLANGKGALVPITVHPRPVQPRFETWLTCTSSIEGFAEAGALGYNVLTALLFQRVEELGGKIEAYRRARQEHGLDPESGTVTLMLHTFVGPSDVEVHELVKPAFKRYLASSTDLWKGEWPELAPDGGNASDEILELAYQRYTRGNSLIGTPEGCARQAARLQELGVDEVACLIDFGVEVGATLNALNHLNEMRLLCTSPRDRSVAASPNA